MTLHYDTNSMLNLQHKQYLCAWQTSALLTTKLKLPTVMEENSTK